jgi:hypothetical protein
MMSSRFELVRVAVSYRSIMEDTLAYRLRQHHIQTRNCVRSIVTAAVSRQVGGQEGSSDVHAVINDMASLIASHDHHLFLCLSGNTPVMTVCAVSCLRMTPFYLLVISSALMLMRCDAPRQIDVRV